MLKIIAKLEKDAGQTISLMSYFLKENATTSQKIIIY